MRRGESDLHSGQEEHGERAVKKILKWKWVRRLRGDLWVVRKSIWPYSVGYATYLPRKKMVLDTGLSKEMAEMECLKMNDPELYELRYGGNGMGSCILQGIRDRADQDLWAVIRFVGPLVVVAMGVMAAFAWWME